MTGMDNPVAIVTGASSGIGKETARALSSNGFIVFGTSRHPDDSFARTRLDVNSDRSVGDCISGILKKSGRIDLLVNNSGIMITGASEEVSISSAKLLFDTNMFGAMRMINAVLPSMRSRNCGRIINIGSMIRAIPVPFVGTYAASKAALAAYSESLRYEVAPFNIHVSLVEPGYFRTGISKRTTRNGKMRFYKQNEDAVINKLDSSTLNGSNPVEVANAILKIARGGKPRFRYLIGKEKAYVNVKGLMPEGMFERAYRKYWNI